jgi:hypothetical protein
MTMNKNTFRFSNDDRERLQGLLKRYDPRKVDYFIESVEKHIELIRFGEGDKGWNDWMKRINRTVRDLKLAVCALEDLKRIGNSAIPIPETVCPPENFKIGRIYNSNLRTINTLTLAEAIISRRNLRTLDRSLGILPMKLVDKAYEPLVELLKTAEGIVKGEKKKRGRPVANDDGLITLIASSYVVHIDIPHPYKGPFSEIISIVFNDDDIDRRRGVRDALKYVSNSLCYRERIWIRKNFNKEQFRDLTPDQQEKLLSASKKWNDINLNFS